MSESPGNRHALPMRAVGSVDAILKSDQVGTSKAQFDVCMNKLCGLATLAGSHGIGMCPLLLKS